MTLLYVAVKLVPYIKGQTWDKGFRKYGAEGIFGTKKQTPTVRYADASRAVYRPAGAVATVPWLGAPPRGKG